MKCMTAKGDHNGLTILEKVLAELAHVAMDKVAVLQLHIDTLVVVHFFKHELCEGGATPPVVKLLPPERKLEIVHELPP